MTVTERTFSGVANSGQPFVYNGKRYIIDLSSVSHHAKVPALLVHDRTKSVGFGTLEVKDNQLLMSGQLLDNDNANEIAKASDVGFPWQMSVCVTAKGAYETDNATINGVNLSEKTTVLTGCHISEVSFTPTGVDNLTAALVMSESSNQQSSKEDDAMSEIDDLKNQNAALQKTIDEMKPVIDELRAEKVKLQTEAKEASVSAQLSASGLKRDDLSEATFAMLMLSDNPSDVIKDLAAKAKPDVPEFLLSQTSTSTQAPTNPLLVAQAQNAKTYI